MRTKLTFSCKVTGVASRRARLRKRRLRKLIRRLRELRQQDLTRDELLMKLGAAKKEAGRAYGLMTIETAAKDQPVTEETFRFALNRKKLRQTLHREGNYLLRSNIEGARRKSCGACICNWSRSSRRSRN